MHIWVMLAGVTECQWLLLLYAVQLAAPAPYI